MKTSLELVRGVDAFPYKQHDPEAYRAFVKSYYEFRIEGYDAVFGLISSSATGAINWPQFWSLNHADRTLTLKQGSGLEERNAFFAETVKAVEKEGKVRALRKLRGEMFPVYGLKGELVLSIDRAASCLFGTVAYGIQMLASTRTDDGLKFWVPRRAKTKKSYPGMLDNCVGGGMSTGEKPLDALVREAAEEASLPEDYVRKYARPYGTLSYHMDRDGNGEEGHQPQVQYVYHIELTPEIVPTPLDGEVEKFELMTLEEVQNALAQGAFKTNCAVTWISYLVITGAINAENEEDLYSISFHLHRRLDFPTK